MRSVLLPVPVVAVAVGLVAAALLAVGPELSGEAGAPGPAGRGGDPGLGAGMVAPGLPGGAGRSAGEARGGPLMLAETMTFAPSPVTAMPVSYWDLYEPAVAVSGTGAIYVTGHTLLADTLRSGAAVSRDGGDTWHPLPSLEEHALPIAEGLGQGNEGIIAADGTGRAWLYDAAWIAGSATLYGWCDDGARLCDLDPLAWDPLASALDCAPTLPDRPWMAAGAGKLVLVQTGLYEPTGGVTGGSTVGPPGPAHIGLYDPDTGAKVWNNCAGFGGQAGPPSIRADGTFAVPQVRGVFEGDLHLAVMSGTDPRVLADARVMDVHTYWLDCQAFNAFGAFDAAGNYWMLAAVDEDTLGLAVSRDLRTFEVTTLDVGAPLHYLWLSGSKTGAGALLSWGTVEADCLHGSFYAAHGRLAGDAPVIADASTVVRQAGYVCGHYYGNDLGPDGRAHVVVFAEPGGNGCAPVPDRPALPLSRRPITVYIQEHGPTV